VSFNQGAVQALFAAILSEAKQLAIFANVYAHEPKSAPGNYLNCAVWLESIQPVRTSGLAETSGKVTFTARIYYPMLQKPGDDIDPDILTATCQLFEVLSEGFTLGGTVRAVDLLGMEGPAFGAQAAYVSQDNRLFRVMDISIPIVINDLWTQEA
jgi:hypothetical protein